MLDYVIGAILGAVQGATFIALFRAMLGSLASLLNFLDDSGKKQMHKGSALIVAIYLLASLFSSSVLVAIYLLSSKLSNSVTAFRGSWTIAFSLAILLTRLYGRKRG
jgi:hypothetical protein